MGAKTNGQIEQAMYDALEDFITATVRGGFYRADTRPANSKAEDAVLKVSNTSSKQVQRGRARLNIHVADIDNGSGRLVPDLARTDELEGIADTVVDILNEADTDYLFSCIQQPDTIADPDTNQHFVSIYLSFKLITFN